MADTHHSQLEKVRTAGRAFCRWPTGSDYLGGRRTHARPVGRGTIGTTVKVALTRPVTVILRAHITRADEDVSTLLNYALAERPNGGCGRTDSLVASRFGTLPRLAGEAWVFDSIAVGARLQ